MNSYEWTKVYEDYVVIECLHLSRTPVLVLDNAPSHTARASREVYKVAEEIGVTTLFQPPASPDLSPLDYWVWGDVKDQMVDYKDLPTLKLATSWAWTWLRENRQAQVEKAPESFMGRIRKCTAVNGGRFEGLDLA